MTTPLNAALFPNILNNSSLILSPEIFLIKEAFFLIDSKVFSSISNPN